MPNTMKNIRETMVKQGISEEIMAQMPFDGQNNLEDILTLINQMDKLLSEEQRLRIMEQQGCSTTGRHVKFHRDFAERNAGKTLAEKLEQSGELFFVDEPPCSLNGDGTLSVFWSSGAEGAYRCVCGYMKDVEQPLTISPTFCGCCGAHARKNLQRSLGVKLKLRQIVSSAASSGGEKRCEFLYDVN
jgi:hypothetical protein